MTTGQPKLPEGISNRMEFSLGFRVNGVQLSKRGGEDASRLNFGLSLTGKCQTSLQDLMRCACEAPIWLRVYNFMRSKSSLKFSVSNNSQGVPWTTEYSYCEFHQQIEQI